MALVDCHKLYVCELIYLLCATNSLHNVQFETKATTTNNAKYFLYIAEWDFVCIFISTNVFPGVIGISTMTYGCFLGWSSRTYFSLFEATDVCNVIGYESDLSHVLILSFWDVNMHTTCIWCMHVTFVRLLSYIFPSSFTLQIKNILILCGFVAAENLVLVDRQ